MILIADSGASKTDWRLIDKDGKVSQAKTEGLSPTYQGLEEIRKVISNELVPQINSEIKEVYFYGAGCSTENAIKTIRGAIEYAYPDAIIEVNHDLLAAARASCNRNPGITCILGTGSNSCLYDGEKIIDNVASLGFILGDEGSGSYMGKKLISDFMRQDMPEELSGRMAKRYSLTREEIIECVYKKPRPGFYLAGFTKFIFDNLKDPYMYNLVYHSFKDFFDTNILKYDNFNKYKVHFVGSVAFYFSDILRQVANDHGLIVKNILESPIAGLTLFHKEEFER